MKLELTPIEEAASEYEREIVHQSTEVAIGHVADVLGDTVCRLANLHFQLSGGAGFSRASLAADRRESFAIAELVIESLTNDPPFDAADIVAVKDVGDRLDNQEYAVKAVRDTVGEILKGLRHDR